MTNTYYSSLSGMLAASLGLQNTSNNVANMQSHGFKRTDVFYSALGNGQGEEGMGHGAHLSRTGINFSQGNCRETNSPSDLAIVGKGFFVIRLKNNDLVYTRDGQFKFINGVLTDEKTGGLVQGYDHAGNLAPIYEKGPQISAGKASRDVFVHGKFIYHQASKKDEPVPDPNKKPPETDPTYENIIFELKNIYDHQGKAHTIKFEFKCNENEKNWQKIPVSWELINVSRDDGIEVPFTLGQKIVFSGNDSAPDSLFDNSIQFTLDENQPITVYFGSNTNGTDESVILGNTSTDQTATTTIEAHQNDGYPQGQQYNLSIDEEGQISYLYDNGQTIKGIHVGLAYFEDMENNLIQTQDNFFRAKTDRGIHYGRANTKGFDAIKSGQLEGSNVDSTAEFANIVVLQRMFQSCSQIMDIDKQLLEELEAKL